MMEESIDQFFTGKEAEAFAELFGDYEYIKWSDKLNEQSRDERENALQESI